MNERLQLLIGKFLLAGLLITLIITIFGGAYYLFQHGEEINNYRIFQKEPRGYSSIQIWQNAFTFSAAGIIQLGILILILTQLFRVALTAWYFFRLKEQKFVWLSLFILAILIYSLFWHI